MRVRLATPADLEPIVGFNLAMAVETESLALDRPTVTRGVQAVLSGAAVGRYYLAEVAGAVVGQLMITTEWSDWRARDVWWIQSVYVVPAARGGGVFRALYRHVEAEARAAGVAGLRLYVEETNTRAQAVYAGLGMRGGHYRVFEAMFAEPPKLS